MAKRPGKRARDRKKAADAVRKGIVALNMSQPKPTATASLVRSRTGHIGVIYGPSVSSDNAQRLQGETHAPGFRAPKGMGHSAVKVIAVRGAHLGRPEATMFNRHVEAHEPRPTGTTDIRFSKLNAYQMHAREDASERKRRAEVRQAWKLALLRRKAGKI